jgi:hypothetical protein
MFCVDLKFGSWISRFPQACFTKRGCLFLVNSFGWVVVTDGIIMCVLLDLLEECAGPVCSRLLGMWEIGWLIGPVSCNGSSEDLGFCVDSCRWFNSCEVGIGEWGLAIYCRGFFFFLWFLCRGGGGGSCVWHLITWSWWDLEPPPGFSRSKSGCSCCCWFWSVAGWLAGWCAMVYGLYCRACWFDAEACWF